ncbi:hypothetical protein I552_0008 [Mycobacterium xenopi 3993]|nr:hypothetical protein I552_0008 [Mycobacterium xenopi 3993]
MMLECGNASRGSLRPTRAPFIQFLRYLSFGLFIGMSVWQIEFDFGVPSSAGVSADADRPPSRPHTGAAVIAALLAIALRGAVAVLVGRSWEPDQRFPLYLGRP